MSPQPAPAPAPPSNRLLVIRTDSLAAILQKLDIKVPVEDIMKAIADDEEAKAEATQAQPRIVLSKGTSALTKPFGHSTDNKFFQKNVVVV
jgi:hypothetical protein